MAKPYHYTEPIFKPESLHNHGSCIVECPNGDLLVCWYNGSGERSADDVKVEGARKRKGSSRWSKRFLMADTIGFPDCNPCMFIDPKGRLWLLWVAIIANEWHTALLRYQISSHYTVSTVPDWDESGIILLKPGQEFVEPVLKAIEGETLRVQAMATENREQLLAYLTEAKRRTQDKYFRRMGWMTRVHPFVLDKKRIIIPLYSDGFDFSIMAISDDLGKTWQVSLPLVSIGGVQPSLIQKRDGTLCAYMRDNGLPPNRIMYSESRDGGYSWSPVIDLDIPNPGSGLEITRLRNGKWALICNDTENGRHSLAVMLSEDEGQTWRWKRHLEYDVPGQTAGSYSYPSIIQGKDGTLHVSYTHQVPNEGKTIEYAHFNEEWVREGCVNCACGGQ